MAPGRGGMIWWAGGQLEVVKSDFPKEVGSEVSRGPGSASLGQHPAWVGEPNLNPPSSRGPRRHGLQMKAASLRPKRGHPS